MFLLVERRVEEKKKVKERIACINLKFKKFKRKGIKRNNNWRPEQGAISLLA